VPQRLIAALGLMSNLTANDGHAESDLHHAAWTGDLEGVERLLAEGHDVNWQDSIGESAIFGAVAWGRLNITARLIAAGADVNLRNNEGWTPLFWGASHGGVEAMKLLLEAGSCVDCVDKTGKSALDIARFYKKNEHVDFLIGWKRGLPVSRK